MSGFIGLSREFLRDPLWINLPLKYQHLYLVILEKVCYKPQKFDDHGVVIDLKPGQVCISERELLKHCSKKLNRNDIQRGIVKLLLCGFLSQEVSHTKNILTITDSRVLEYLFLQSEPESEPKVSQDRAIKEQVNTENTIPVVVVRKKISVEEKETALALHKFLSNKAHEWNTYWNIPQPDIEKLILKHGSAYINDQIQYMLELQTNNENLKKNPYNKKKVEDIGNALAYLRRCCNENYADSINKK